MRNVKCKVQNITLCTLHFTFEPVPGAGGLDI
jgi:hypothetical protein